MKSIYLTSIRLNPEYLELSLEKENAYFRQQRVKSIFPNSSRKKLGVLFKWTDEKLFIQSFQKPKIENIPLSYALAIDLEQQNLFDVVQQKSLLHFEILLDLAYPLISSTGNKKRYVVPDYQWVESWFHFKLESCAIVMQPLHVKKEQKIFVRQPNGNQWTISPLKVSGYLKVINSELLTTFITEGLGKSKAYGCGLFQTSLVNLDSTNLLF